MSVNVNTNTNTVTVQDASQTITIVDNGKSNTINIPQPLINVIEVATPGPAGPAGANGANGASISTSSLATTGSNVFIGNQTISGSTISFSSSLLINNPDDQQWGIGLNNRSFTPLTPGNSPHFGIWVQNDGQTYLGTEYGQALNIYSNTTNDYSRPAIKVTGSNALITGSLFGTASWAYNIINGSTINTSSFATTGSNTFIGNQTITGSINFGDGSLIQSISASSGDGGGYTTLTLKPNTSVISDQYIVLDPTTPNHIHIRAGGTIDSSSAYLYLGGEKANVVVRNLDNSFNEKYWVQINSQTGSTQNTWIFDDNGTLTAPGTIEAPSFSGSFTGSLEGTATTASYVNILNQNLIVSGNFTVHNTTTGFDSINSDFYYLFDNSGNRSVMWNDRVLKDSSGVGSVDWESRQFVDGGSSTSADWASRTLYADDGTTSQLRWNDPAYISLPSIIENPVTNILGIDGSGRMWYTASNALSVKTAQTASYLNTLNQNLTLSGSLTILNNLTVFGTQSINYITSSQLDISTNIITVNTSTPTIRFGGIAVRDSGSLATGLTGSLLWDSQNDVWIYSNPSGAAYDGGMLLTGPRNTSGLGNEVGITTNYLSKGNGSHHMTSSQISDDGTTVTIPGNLSVSSGITGSLFGTASWATNFVSASNYVLNNATSSFVTNSQTSSMSVATASRATTSSFAITSSFAQNVYAPVFITYTGGNQSNGATTLTNVHTASATMSIATIGFYEFELYTTYNVTATSVGIKYSLSGSNSFSYLATQVNYSISGSDRATFMFNSWDGGGTASSSNATTGNTAYIYGHVNATSTGPIFLRQASEIGGQTVTTTNVTGYLRRLY